MTTAKRIERGLFTWLMVTVLVLSGSNAPAAIDGDPEHKCMGRAALARLSRAMKIAEDAGLQLPEIKGIYRRMNIS